MAVVHDATIFYWSPGSASGAFANNNKHES